MLGFGGNGILIYQYHSLTCPFQRVMFKAISKYPTTKSNNERASDVHNKLLHNIETSQVYQTQD